LYRAALRFTCRDGISAKKVVFNQTDGNGYGCNQKYIAEELLRRHPDWDFVWLVRDVDGERPRMPAAIRLVRFDSFAAMKELSTAKVWCSNQFFRHHVKRCGLQKRPGQRYIQTWHGSMGIKVVHSGASWERRCPDSAGNSFKRDEAGMIDYVIANSTWDAEQQLDFFYGHGEVKMFGHPRNDILFDVGRTAEASRKVRAEYGLPDDCRILLYVPTLRLDKGWDGYMRDFSGMEASLAGKFGGRWKTVARMHPVLLHKGRSLGNSGGALDASGYPDIQELLAASDALVSDYSSCMFDFMLTHRPCFAYVPDLDQYEKEQGLVYPLSETPFPVSKTVDGLLESVRSFDAASYPAAVDAFAAGKGCCEDGHASERVADLVEQCVMEGA